MKMRRVVGIPTESRKREGMRRLTSDLPALKHRNDMDERPRVTA